jgi:transposase
VYFTGGMPNPHAMALRERAVAAYERGEGAYTALAALFNVDVRTLQRWVARWRNTGSVAPQPKGGGWHCPIVLPMLRAVIADAPDATVAELCWEYNRRVTPAERTTETSFRRAMHRDGYVLKKNGRGRRRSIGRMSARNATRS